MSAPPSTPDALLDAAEALFSARGYVSVGIREIAEAAGTNIASIKYHFGSKRELYLATVRRVMSRHEGTGPWAHLREAPADRLDAAVRLARFVRGYLSALPGARPHHACGALMLWEALQPSEAIDTVVRDYVRPGSDALVAVVRRLLPPGEQVRAELHARSVLGQVLHYRAFRPFIARLAREEGAATTAPDAVATHIIAFSLRAMGADDAFVERALRAADDLPAGARTIEAAARAVTQEDTEEVPS